MSASQVPTDGIEIIRTSGILPTQNYRDFGNLIRQWSTSDSLWRKGKYFDSVDLRRELLAKAYAKQGVDPAESAPPMLSAGYASNIGHLGLLGMHWLSRKLGLLENSERALIVGPHIGNARLLSMLPKDMPRLVSRGTSTVFDTPAAWPHVERLQMVNRNGDFVDIYQMWEDLVANVALNGMPSSSPFLLDQEYFDAARTQLAVAGLPPDAWFVSLHTRTSNFPADLRSMDPTTANSAVNEVIAAGGWVVHFGTESQDRLQPRPGLIDLSYLGPAQNDLHPYLLSESTFIVSSNSGPTVPAWIMGTDVLVVNATSIGRNTLSTWTNSMYLPRIHVSRHGQDLPLEALLSSHLAWSEYGDVRFLPQGSESRPNTEGEILEAVRDMMTHHGLSNRGELRSPRLAHRAQELRIASRAVSFGNFAPSYLRSSTSGLDS